MRSEELRKATPPGPRAAGQKSLAPNSRATGAVDTHRVAAALRRQSLPEFFTHITYDSNQQGEGPLVVLQRPSVLPERDGNSSSALEIVFPLADSVRPLVFPAPTWAQRRCERSGCGGVRGRCVEGKCICNHGYVGTDCEFSTSLKSNLCRA